MHVIQYLMNLNLKCFAYDGQGKINLSGVSYTSITIFEFRSILKFIPFDIGYDLKGIEWRVVNVYYENNISFYDAFNGINIVRFDNFNLFNASEINAIYQNKLDDEIETIINKINQLNSYVTTETQPLSLPLKFKPNNITHDFNSKIKSATNKTNQLESATLVKNKFSKGELCFDNKLNVWTVINILNLKNKIKYQATNGKITKIFNENDLKKKSLK